MSDPVIVPTDNNQQVAVVSQGDILTLRVQTLTGHNRAVAKLGPRSAEALYDILGKHVGE
jgi:hypothetical protein